MRLVSFPGKEPGSDCWLNFDETSTSVIML